MNNNFGPESTNPRDRRAFAHAMIKRFNDGEATYREAFEAAHAACNGRKGERSEFGKPLGKVVVVACAQVYVDDTVTGVVSGLSQRKQEEVAIKKAGGVPYGYSPDAYMVRPDANNTPDLNGTTIVDPIAEGYSPLKTKRH